MLRPLVFIFICYKYIYRIILRYYASLAILLSLRNHPIANSIYQMCYR